MATHRFSARQIGIAAVCAIGALLLLGAALMEGERSEQEEWLPLNEAVEAALNELEQPNRETMIPQPDAAEPSQSPPSAEDVEPVTEDAEQSLPQTDSGNLLDLNRASSLELQLLKGIGPSKAQAIVDDRERNGFYKNVEDLLRVKGIGEKLLAGIKESVVARP